MPRKEQMNNQNGAVLNRDFPRRSRSLFIGAEELRQLFPNGKRKKFNVYAESRDQCEVKLAEMIERVKAEIAEEKAKLKEGAD